MFRTAAMGSMQIMVLFRTSVLFLLTLISLPPVLVLYSPAMFSKDICANCEPVSANSFQYIFSILNGDYLAVPGMGLTV